MTICRKETLRYMKRDYMNKDDNMQKGYIMLKRDYMNIDDNMWK